MTRGKGQGLAKKHNLIRKVNTSQVSVKHGNIKKKGINIDYKSNMGRQLFTGVIHETKNVCVC